MRAIGTWRRLSVGAGAAVLAAGAALVLTGGPAYAATTLTFNPGSGPIGSTFQAHYSTPVQPSDPPCPADPVFFGIGNSAGMGVWGRGTLAPDCTATATLTVPTTLPPGTYRLAAVPRGRGWNAYATFTVVPGPSPKSSPSATGTSTPARTAAPSHAPSAVPAAIAAPTSSAPAAQDGSASAGVPSSGPALADPTPSSSGLPLWGIGLVVAAILLIGGLVALRRGRRRRGADLP